MLLMRAFSLLMGILVVLTVPRLVRAATVCQGDCDSSGTISINELIVLVNIALGNGEESDCAQGILSSAAVDIALLVRAVNNALSGCAVNTRTETPADLPTPTPSTMVELAVTGSDGIVHLSGGTLTVKIVDFSNGAPVQNVDVTLVGSNGAGGLVVVDPLGRYATRTSTVSDTIAQGSILSTAPDGSSDTLQVALVGKDYVAAPGSTLPLALNESLPSSIWDSLSSQFMTCDVITLGQVQNLLEAAGEHLVDEQLAGGTLLSSALVLAPVFPVATGAIGAVEGVTTVTSMAAAGLSALEYRVYVARGYLASDPFFVCHVKEENPIATQILDHGFMIRPLEGPRGMVPVSTLIGRWEGQVYQPHPGERYPVVMAIDTVDSGRPAGSIEYPTLECGGALTFLEETADGENHLREQITTGKSNCVNGGLISVSFVSADTLNWEWFYPDGMLGAFASLTRVGPGGTPTVHLTAPVFGRFFPNPKNLGTFSATPASAVVFTQSFPSISFDPPRGVLNCSNPTHVDNYSRPFTAVVPQADGSCSTILAAGSGYQAGSGDLAAFNAVFSGSLTVSIAASVTFSVYGDDGWILGLGRDTSGAQPEYVSGAMANVPPNAALLNLPVVGGSNQGQSALTAKTVVVDFPVRGVYPLEIDYSEAAPGTGLGLTIVTSGQPIQVQQ